MSDIQDLLRRGVLDLSIMIRGIDRELDETLDQLKLALRQRNDLDVDAFGKALEATDKRFDLIENRTEEGVTHLYSLYQLLIDTDDERVPDTLIRQIGERSPYVHDALTLAQQIQPLISLGADPDADSSTLIRLRQKLCSRFITLLRTLAILGDEDGALRSLAARLEPIPDWTTLDVLAAETIMLIQTRLNQEKGKFEYYLNELNAKLVAINRLIGEDQHAVTNLQSLNDSLNANVDHQLERVRSELETATDMQSLRLAMTHSMDDLLGVLSEFQDQVKSSLSGMHQRQAELTQQLTELQTDNRRLIEQVHQERELSLRDPLTQLPNRQGFDARLAEEIARSERYQQPCCVALIDIDLFKTINDQYGHLAGDKVLKVLAKEMRSQVRQSDYLARFGGEEFVLLLPQTPIDAGMQALEKMRLHISQCPFNFQGKPVQITFSAGVSAYRNGESADQWLHRADEALYTSKGAGRNRTTSADG
ncbi:GGDEF domain-containing protein [Saccharospirillum impatiens]|uniref:GGDEF domain-containing protein n=1 Tax=Saccharospirillum impatiens TaxID=169438 RepID=UPI00040E689F|nr:diguanylate cyclase [Saccharospirillum impatiens]